MIHRLSPLLLAAAALAASANDPREVARNFMRCGFIYTKLSHAEKEPTRLTNLQTAATVFVAIGAVAAAGQEFVTAEAGRSAEAFLLELRAIPDTDPKALAAFLQAEEQTCRALFRQYKETYFAK